MLKSTRLMPEQDVHEIQLNGKQLVFMFMAATVVSIVIFLCGVMVGRGVRPPQPDAFALASTTDDTTFDPTASGESATAPSVDTTTAAAVTADNLTYAERLESTAPLDDRLKMSARVKAGPAALVAETAVALPPASENVAPATVAAKPAAGIDPVPASGTFAEPPGDGYVVQVMAFAVRADAEGLANRLKAKGYPAFVTGGGGATKTMYRVRVGKYGTQKEAQAISTRLKREEKFDPWLPPR